MGRLRRAVLMPASTVIVALNAQLLRRARLDPARPEPAGPRSPKALPG